ncbi:RNA polymerase III transcription factor IIIC subunit-domain-containing protein [Gamsiella multidivaricata]|uniref:RNA polymerase III transcription factor IIIC subunit-domain-containing protein n=1 Tax=Gamsiella multidivaricata TaxID=101098 RepID=UPI002220E557|nr:RNA polymerase III transcription factor IIIC subunit-domain-containing protein [Gamsiella multidivaricata]KAI7816009.1 RNA polymerase III transcription factor IIIC subunit-domain-containing protein [Gamsiella multidivaricata]
METTPKAKFADIQSVPDTKIFSVEFPGHVQNLDKVKEALGGDQAIANAYHGGAPLDLRYRIKDPFSIPIQGETISTPNLLMKATKRYRVKRPLGTQRSLPPYRAPTEADEPYDEDEEPEYRFEMVGAIPKTVRFGGLADYQHIVDPRDELVQIKSDLQNMEYEQLISIKVDNTHPTEDLSTLQLLPPPAVAKAPVPMPFKYKARGRDDEPKNPPGRQSKRKARPGELATTVDFLSGNSDDDEPPK